MAHTLLDPEIDSTYNPKVPLVRYECSCREWRRVVAQGNEIPQQELESAHEQHRQWAGAEELRLGYTKPDRSLESILRSMAALAEASVKATESMSEFIEAHKAAKDKNVGILVVRKPDGSATSTPNVFIPQGTAIFMDEPGPFVPGPIEFPRDEAPVTSVRHFIDKGSRPIVAGEAA